MLDLLPAPDPVVAMRATGRIDEADIERGIEAVEAALQRHPRIAIYAEVEMSSMTPGAFLRDLGYGLGKVRDLSRFPRLAVVTSQDWLRYVAWVQDRILFCPRSKCARSRPPSGTRRWSGHPSRSRKRKRKRKNHREA